MALQRFLLVVCTAYASASAKEIRWPASAATMDFIKIDGAFVRDIATNPIDLAMVQSIHGIAKAMQIKTIAEFVESAQAVEMLEAMGVHYGQGFHLGKPVPIEQAILSLDRPSIKTESQNGLQD